MNVDDLTEKFMESVRAEVEREIGRAQKVVAALNADKAKAQSALSELQTQCELAKTQLTAVTADLKRASGLVGIDSEIAGARKTLEQLNRETAEATKSVAALGKQREDAQHQLNAVWDEVRRLRGERSEAVAEITKIRALVQQSFQ
jgi:chromosome segregation ATPase